MLAAENGSGGGGGSFIVLFVLLAAFYFFAIRPQRNRLKAAQQIQATLSPGQRVITTAGLYGTVRQVDDETVTLEVSPGVELVYVRAAIGKLLDVPADGQHEAIESD